MTQAPPLISCKYCKHVIDLDEPGWGFNELREFWHLECYQMCEGVDLGDKDANNSF